MIEKNDLYWLHWGRRGLIPGPYESEEEFLARVSNLKVEPDQNLWERSHKITSHLFDFSIDWVPLYFSNKKLSFWEGAALWVSKSPAIQLRENFKKGSYLGYKLEEVLAHEAVHAARILFEEPQFEEVLAYRTSKNRLRKWIGPLFRKPWEAFVFMLTFGASLLGYFWLPLSFLAWLGFKLAWAQWTLQRCLKKLPLSVVVCLTDEEIRRFSSLPLAEIEAHFENDQTLRGHSIKCRIGLSTTPYAGRR